MSSTPEPKTTTDSISSEISGEVGRSHDRRTWAVTWRTYLRAVGPGLIAGASDTDPTTVATIAIIGAGTVYGMGWCVLLLFPVIAVIQSIATRVGVAGRLDLQAAVRAIYRPALGWLLLGSILVVNIVTIAADLEAGAAALGLLTGGDWRLFAAPLSVVLLAAVMLLGYHALQRAMKYLLLVLLAYAATAVLAHPDWGAVARGSLVPRVQWNRDFLFNVLSLIGTTATSYVYVWQTISQSEEKIPWHWHRVRQFDAVAGSLFATVVFWFILVATGATLGVNGLSVETAQDAARSLRPVAGAWAGSLFALGLLASALVALPVIIATTAYVTGTHLNWRRGLSLRPREAPKFFAAMGASVLVGLAAASAGMSPIQLLYWAGVVGAFGAPVGLAVLVGVASNSELMDGHAIGTGMKTAGWSIAVLITLVSAAGLYQLIAVGP
ncbi:divalent metal cation transporter [Streptomyces yunnanensis]|uniref:Divalent metal cation transporter n=1 Tax=Streptomyces yunnanensis TaxID=156453 RepID=A0ABY8AH83_9ACTN|nr:divalent metal cation transporter [Streptomyces yunnanensis]WEB43596.1 divalent metal cation transporter [Streptomyces yunnanensis]